MRNKFLLETLRGGKSLDQVLDASAARIAEIGSRSSGYAIKTKSGLGFSEATLYPQFSRRLGSGAPTIDAEEDLGAGLNDD